VTVDVAVLVGIIGTLTTAIGTVARFVYLDLRKDRDYWRETALALMKVNDRAVDVAAASVRNA
jgi:hypothetical protein